MQEFIYCHVCSRTYSTRDISIARIRVQYEYLYSTKVIACWMSDEVRDTGIDVLFSLASVLFVQRGTFSLTTVRSVILDDFGVGYFGRARGHTFMRKKTFVTIDKKD